MKTTAKQLASNLGVAYPVANSLIKLLQVKGVASEVDKVSSSDGGRGRKTSVYQLPDAVTFDFSGDSVEVTSIEETAPAG